MLGALLLVTWRFRRLSILLSIAASSSAAAHVVLRGPSTGCEASVSPQLQGRLASTITPACDTDPSWLHCHVAGGCGDRAHHRPHARSDNIVDQAAFVPIPRKRLHIAGKEEGT